MKYNKATAVLPPELVEELQGYVQGEYIYVPIKEGHRISWGEISGYKQDIEKRNLKIKQAYAAGVTINELSEMFYLSIYSIRKIIYEK